jgi:formylglycine-generating enzyme required for sulfatase activity
MARAAGVTRRAVVLALGGIAGLKAEAQTRCPPGQRRTPNGCEPSRWLPAEGGALRLPSRPPPARVTVTVSERGQDAQGRWEVVRLNGAPMRFRWIAPGTFTMGSPQAEVGRLPNEGPQHEVVLTRGFWLGETEVTQAQWRAVMGANPSHFPGDDRPVERVSWDEVQRFLQGVNGRGGRFRLPTEAEWEYAARAGSTGARYGALDEIAWYGGNSGRQTHPVGQKAANAWGLRDMLGNVWEWCSDRAVRWQDGYSEGRAVDPRGPSTGPLRVARGGSCSLVAPRVRVALRVEFEPSFLLSLDPDGPSDTLGFRLVRDP